MLTVKEITVNILSDILYENRKIRSTHKQNEFGNEIQVLNET